MVLTEPPVIQPQPSELDVILNNPILLPCEATGTPSPFITWQKEGISVISSGTVSLKTIMTTHFYHSEVSIIFLTEVKIPLTLF